MTLSMTLEPKEYKKIINAQSEQIDELCAVIHAIRGSKIANIMPFVARLIKERNELDIQRSDALDKFHKVNNEFVKCREVTRHFGSSSVVSSSKE